MKLDYMNESDKTRTTNNVLEPEGPRDDGSMQGRLFQEMDGHLRELTRSDERKIKRQHASTQDVSFSLPYRLAG
jgi:hypothetical protein